MSYRIVACVLACSFALLADTLVLRTGKTVEGTFLGGDSRSIRMAVGEAVQSFPIADVTEIKFGAAKAAPAKALTTRGATSATGQKRLEAQTAAASPAPAPMAKEVAAGTALVVRMIDDVDSSRDQAGQTFRASIDEDVVIDGQTLIPRNSDVVVKLIEEKQAGKLTGSALLTLDIQSVVVNGKAIEVKTGEVTQRGASRTKQTAVRTGGAAAVGAIIGAIAGGGKGAAIGAATGAGAAGAVQVLTKGPKVQIPSETRLTFTLTHALVL